MECIQINCEEEIAKHIKHLRIFWKANTEIKAIFKSLFCPSIPRLIHSWKEVWAMLLFINWVGRVGQVTNRQGVNKVCCPAWQNTPNCVSKYCASLSLSVYFTCPLCWHWVGWLSSVAIHLAWLKRYHWYRTYRTGKHSVKLGTLTVTLTLDTTIKSFHRYSGL